MHVELPELPEETQLIVGELRNLIKKSITEEKIAEYEQAKRLPGDTVEALFQQGFMGMMTPEEYGGSASSMTTMTAVAEELAAAWASLMLAWSVQNTLAPTALLLAGSEEQKQHWLPRMAQSDLAAFALTEPDCGSDSAALQLKAEESGAGWRLTGRKLFITNAVDGKIAIVYARTAPEKHAGISAFMVDLQACTESGGLSVNQQMETKLGVNASPTAELAFENCEVPHDALIGAEGEGFMLAMKTLDIGRVTIAAQALGIARAALEAAKVYSHQRRAFGKKLKDLDKLRAKLAWMQTKFDAAKLLTYRAAWLQDQGKAFTRTASEAKLFATKAAEEITNDAVQLHGGVGVMMPVERYYREAKVFSIYEGTTEIQENIIARELLD